MASTTTIIWSGHFWLRPTAVFPAVIVLAVGIILASQSRTGGDEARTATASAYALEEDREFEENLEEPQPEFPPTPAIALVPGEITTDLPLGLAEGEHSDLVDIVHYEDVEALRYISDRYQRLAEPGVTLFFQGTDAEGVRTCEVQLGDSGEIAGTLRIQRQDERWIIVGAELPVPAE